MMGIWFRCLGVVGAIWLSGAAMAQATSAPLRQLEIRVTDHKPGIADFQKLDVKLKSVSIHTKGHPRKEGWHTLVTQAPFVDIVPLKDGRYKTIGTPTVPAGRYDALRIEFSQITGKLHTGKTPALVARDTVVGTNVDLRETQAASILIDLFAESQTDHTPKRYVVKVKEVRVGR